MKNIALQWSEQELEFNREDLFNGGYIFPQNILPTNRNVDPVESERQDDEYHFYSHKRRSPEGYMCNGFA